MAAIHAGRRGGEHGRPLRIVALDGAKTIGAKILVAGGGRCNVTHHAVDASDYAGDSPNAIRKVLKAFDVPATVAFFRELGVALKREETGKLFPTTDRARTVLDALLEAVRDAGAEIRNPARVVRIDHIDGVFAATLEGNESSTLRARRLILATGGKALPRSGSDGVGYEFAKSLGHSITPHVFPALAPLTLPKRHALRQLSGLTTEAALTVRSGSGKRLHSFKGSLLLTHFGISGPAPMNVSRHLTAARIKDVASGLLINFAPGADPEDLEAALQNGGKAQVSTVLGRRLPARLAETLCQEAGVDPSAPCHGLTREQRRGLVRAVTEYDAPITGDRGYTFAEATAGGVPLREINLKTMESRITPGLHIIGEICDVDGRIGGFNFQWAWASGYLGGIGAAAGVLASGAKA